MKNKFSQAIVLSMVTLSSVALLTACSSHKESSSADKMPKSSQVTSSSKAKTSSKDSGKVSKSSAKVKESSGSKTESSSVPSSKKASATSSSSSQAQSSSSNSSSVPSSSQSQAPKSSNENQSSASQSQAPKNSSDSQTSSTQSSSQAQAKTDTQVTPVDMDVSAVARGQFDSIAGTWKNGKGMTLTFDKNGLVSDTERIGIEYSKVTDGYLKSGTSPKSGVGAAGGAMAFLPKGISLTGEITSSPNEKVDDQSDKSKDRIWGG